MRLEQAEGNKKTKHHTTLDHTCASQWAVTRIKRPASSERKQNELLPGSPERQSSRHAKTITAPLPQQTAYLRQKPPPLHLQIIEGGAQDKLMASNNDNDDYETMKEPSGEN